MAMCSGKKKKNHTTVKHTEKKLINSSVFLSLFLSVCWYSGGHTPWHFNWVPGRRVSTKNLDIMQLDCCVVLSHSDVHLVFLSLFGRALFFPGIDNGGRINQRTRPSWGLPAFLVREYCAEWGNVGRIKGGRLHVLRRAHREPQSSVLVWRWELFALALCICMCDQSSSLCVFSTNKKQMGKINELVEGCPHRHA